MGKRDTRVAFVNPIAASRSSGTAGSGTSIKDYLNRPRPSWDELKEEIKSKRKGSRTLEEFEQKLNRNYRAGLDKDRDKFFNSTKKKKNKRKRSHSSSSSTSTSLSNSSETSLSDRRSRTLKKKKRKYKNHHERDDSVSYSEDELVKEIEKKQRLDKNVLSSDSSSQSEWEEASVVNKKTKKSKRKKKIY